MYDFFKEETIGLRHQLTFIGDELRIYLPATYLADDSGMVTYNGFYYAVIVDGDNFILGKFKPDLTLACSSKLNVNSSTPIMVTDKGVVVTSSKGNLVLLKADDLSQITE